jgi:nucleoside-diphosphate-sugar epimerase
MKKVLLTGATGFIGRECIPFLLESGYEVHVVSSKVVEIQVDVYWHQANLLDLGQVRELMARVQPSHLLHLAWYAIPGKYWTSIENFQWVQASLELLQTFVQHGGQRVVMAGTCAEYDWKYGYCSEEITPLSPTTVYGICKHSLQTMLAAFARQTGISAAWGRIFFLYGPYEYPTRLVASVIHSLLKGEPARCSHGNQIRDFLYVEDVASAFVALLKSDVQGAFNIGSAQPVALKEAVLKIGEKMGHLDLIRLGEIPTANDDPPMLIADTRKLHDQVKWSPKYSLDTGLAKTIELISQ